MKTDDKQLMAYSDKARWCIETLSKVPIGSDTFFNLTKELYVVSVSIKERKNNGRRTETNS